MTIVTALLVFNAVWGFFNLVECIYIECNYKMWFNKLEKLSKEIRGKDNECDND